jgi:uncharacterized protein (TIGR02145 family)
MMFFNRLGRAVLLATTILAGIACLSGCDGNKDALSTGKSWVLSMFEKAGTVTDKRDGQKYRSVKIGNQVWMAENLSFKIGDSWCYDNDESNCQQYGRLYDWNMAKLACPTGWHLPSREEWTELETVVGSSIAGKKLKAASGWNENDNGTDDYGFSALPSGIRFPDGRFFHIGDNGTWWTATERGSGSAYYRSMGYINAIVSDLKFDKDNGFSVRCVAD